MSAQHRPPGQGEECPHCIVVFYGFFITANDPTQPRNAIVQDHVARVVAIAASRGFTLADDLAELVANGEHYSAQALWIATRLGEVIGVDLMQSMVSGLLAELKSKQFNPPGETA
ncbi:hypothetical protein ACEN9F_30485 [Duganella sp. CT11-25]|uniref:hypothetical protein n=1 Tax=unclassified Duganella TaxID=2636909 RepID=UPI0039B11028